MTTPEIAEKPMATTLAVLRSLAESYPSLDTPEATILRAAGAIVIQRTQALMEAAQQERTP